MSAEGSTSSAEGLLDGLEGDAARRAPGAARAPGRRMACRWRSCAGTPRTGTLMFLPAERVIGGADALHRRARSRSSAASSVEFLLAARRAMGLPVPGPDERRLHRGRPRGRRRSRAWRRRPGSPTRRSSSCCARSAAGSRRRPRAMRALPLRLVLEPGLSEHDLAQRYAPAAVAALPRCSVR